MRLTSDVGWKNGLSNRESYHLWWKENADYMHKVVYRYTIIVDYLNQGLPDKCTGRQWRNLTPAEEAGYRNSIPAIRRFGLHRWSQFVQRRNILAHAPGELFSWNAFAEELLSSDFSALEDLIKMDKGTTYR